MLTPTTIYRIDGTSATISYIDAREAVQNNPGEWSFNPFSAEQVKTWLKKQDDKSAA